MIQAAFPRTRLFTTRPLAPRSRIALDKSRTHYLRTVLRLGIGERIRLFNGVDGEWIASIDELSKNDAILRVTNRTRAQRPEPDIWLAFAALKKTPMDFVAEKATELGASVLQPFMAERSNVARVNGGRLAATARDAAQQCERLSVPEVRDCLDFETILADWPGNRRLFAMDETGGGAPFVALLHKAGRREKHAILVGPEGGFTEAERARLDARPRVARATLGGRVLRAETACLTALALWQNILGDGATPPGG